MELWRYRVIASRAGGVMNDVVWIPARLHRENRSLRDRDELTFQCSMEHMRGGVVPLHRYFAHCGRS